MKVIINKWCEETNHQYEEIRIDPWDTWNMNTTLAKIILPMLQQLKLTKHGSPGDLPEFQQTSDHSHQRCFDFYGEDNELAWAKGHQHWESILDHIIWSFEQLLCDWEAQYWIVHPELDLSDYPEDEGKELTPVRWKVEGECDWAGRMKHQERINQGLKLFGEYYQGLWD